MVGILSLLLLSGCSPSDWLDERSDRILETVRRAQEANLERFPHGDLRCRILIRQRNPTYLSHREIHAQWDGPKLWASIKEVSAFEAPAAPGNPAHEEQWILDGTRRILYHPGGKQVLISSVASSEQPASTLWGPPAQFWYGPLDMEGATWRLYLDPSLVPSIDASTVEFTVRERPDGLVEIERRDQGFDDRCRFVVSLEREGNVVEYQIDAPSPNSSFRGETHWERDNSGAWYPKRSFLTMKSEVLGRVVEIEKTLEILSFDPQHRPNPARFTLESLHLPGGTRIEDEIHQQVRRIGDAETQSVVDQLDSLVEQVRQHGFASERR